MTESTVTDIAVYDNDEAAQAIERLRKNDINIYASFPASEDAADDILDALANAEKIADHLGETINLVHVVAEVRESTNERTGELEKYVATTLIDADGTSYTSGSESVRKEIERIIALKGEPSTWTKPYPCRVTEEGQRPNQWFKLAGVRTAPKAAAKK